MVKKAITAWINAGVTVTSTDNITPVCMTNIMALLVILFSLLQVPTTLYFLPDFSRHELYVSFVTVILLSFVPLLNALKVYQLARCLLITVYLADIAVSCLIWQININIQYLFLLAVFMSPLLFNLSQIYAMWLVSISAFCGFIGFELWFYIASSELETALYPQEVELSYAALFGFSSLLCSYQLWKNVDKSWQKLAKEKRRSEELLLNVLPLSIAQRLKDSPALIADYFPQASILFADIQNFTPLCKDMSPQQLVELLNEVFCAFDTLSQHYGLEKIKTSGDGYMAAGGLPDCNSIHALQCCHCALDMQQAFQKINHKYHLHTRLRIGIGCGEVIAGIIGKNKFSYDMWGEAVNLASRMESHGIGNKIQTTESTYQLTKHAFKFVKRGGISIKGVGKVTTYWLIGRKQHIGKLCTT